MRIAPSERPSAPCNCWRGPQGPARTSGLSAANASYQRQAAAAVRRMQGVSVVSKKYGAARVEDVCAVALDLEVYDYRFVRRYLERTRKPPLSLRQVDPLIRQLTLYRDLIEERTQETTRSLIHEHP